MRPTAALVLFVASILLVAPQQVGAVVSASQLERESTDWESLLSILERHSPGFRGAEETEQHVEHYSSLIEASDSFRVIRSVMEDKQTLNTTDLKGYWEWVTDMCTCAWQDQTKTDKQNLELNSRLHKKCTDTAPDTLVARGVAFEFKLFPELASVNPMLIHVLVPTKKMKAYFYKEKMETLPTGLTLTVEEMKDDMGFSNDTAITNIMTTSTAFVEATVEAANQTQRLMLAKAIVEALGLDARVVKGVRARWHWRTILSAMMRWIKKRWANLKILLSTVIRGFVCIVRRLMKDVRHMTQVAVSKVWGRSKAVGRSIMDKIKQGSKKGLNLIKAVATRDCSSLTYAEACSKKTTSADCEATCAPGEGGHRFACAWYANKCSPSFVVQPELRADTSGFINGQIRQRLTTLAMSSMKTALAKTKNAWDNKRRCKKDSCRAPGEEPELGRLKKLMTKAKELGAKMGHPSQSKKSLLEIHQRLHAALSTTAASKEHIMSAVDALDKRMTSGSLIAQAMLAAVKSARSRQRAGAMLPFWQDYSFLPVLEASSTANAIVGAKRVLSATCFTDSSVLYGNFQVQVGVEFPNFWDGVISVFSGSPLAALSHLQPDVMVAFVPVPLNGEVSRDCLVGQQTLNQMEATRSQAADPKSDADVENIMKEAQANEDLAVATASDATVEELGGKPDSDAAQSDAQKPNLLEIFSQVRADAMASALRPLRDAIAQYHEAGSQEAHAAARALADVQESLLQLHETGGRAHNEGLSVLDLTEGGSGTSWLNRCHCGYQDDNFPRNAATDALRAKCNNEAIDMKVARAGAVEFKVYPWVPDTGLPNVMLVYALMPQDALVASEEDDLDAVEAAAAADAKADEQNRFKKAFLFVCGKLLHVFRVMKRLLKIAVRGLVCVFSQLYNELTELLSAAKRKFGELKSKFLNLIKGKTGKDKRASVFLEELELLSDNERHERIDRLQDHLLHPQTFVVMLTRMVGQLVAVAHSPHVEVGPTSLVEEAEHTHIQAKGLGNALQQVVMDCEASDQKPTKSGAKVSHGYHMSFNIEFPNVAKAVVALVIGDWTGAAKAALPELLLSFIPTSLERGQGKDADLTLAKSCLAKKEITIEEVLSDEIDSGDGMLGSEADSVAVDATKGANVKNSKDAKATKASKTQQPALQPKF